MLNPSIPVPPDESGTITRTAVDKCIAMRIEYIGSQASALIDIANATGDITLKHGAASSEAADTTVNPSGASPGTIDLSADAATFKALIDVINASSNWRAWLVDALPTDATEASGTAKIINNISGGDADVAGGYVVYIDTSEALYHSIGITAQGINSKVHNTDAGMKHWIKYLTATTTYSSGTSNIYIYAVNDQAGTVTELDSFAAGATTVAKTVGDGTQYIWSTEGQRLVVKVVNSAAMTAAVAQVIYASQRVGPGFRKDKLYGRSTY